MKRAQLVAEAIAVLCPFCAEPQPNKRDGSEQWTKENFIGVSQTLKCSACDAWFMLTNDTKVMFR